MKTNPCRYCASSYEYRGRHVPGLCEKCCSCQYILKHKEYLKSQRKFVEGEPIADLNELLQQTWVMFGGRPSHIEVIKHMQLNTILKLIHGSSLKKAILKSQNTEGVKEK